MSNKLDVLIVRFLKKHHVVTLSVAKDNKPWIFHAFYVFDDEGCRLIISSSLETQHGKMIGEKNTAVAAICLETKVIGKIEGVQMRGVISVLENLANNEAKRLYLKKFPYAIAHLDTLWAFDIEYLKMTSNRLGFGKKLIWERT